MMISGFLFVFLIFDEDIDYLVIDILGYCVYVFWDGCYDIDLLFDIFKFWLSYI